MKKQQSALFKVQLWHLRAARDHERTLRRVMPCHLNDAVGQRIVRDLKRRADLHRKFIDAITPFVQSPISGHLSSCTCIDCKA